MLLLLVEQDAAVRELLQYALRLEGHEVEAVSRRTEMQEALASGRPFDAVVSDIVLPQDRGHAEAIIAAEARDIPVLLMTGDTATMVELDERRIFFLPKPFQIDRLFDWIRNKDPSCMAVDQAAAAPDQGGGQG